MNAPQPLTGLFCVCDVNGHLVHTTVAISPQDAIDEWLSIEGSMNSLANLCRTVKKEPKKCLPSWEGFEAEGYRIVRVQLLPEL